MSKKIKIIVEYEAYEPDEEHDEPLTLKEVAAADVESFESDPAELLNLSIENIRFKLVDD